MTVEDTSGPTIKGLRLTYTTTTSSVEQEADIPLTTIGGNTKTYEERVEMFVDAVKNGHTFMYPAAHDPKIVLGIKTSLISYFTLRPVYK